MALDIAVELFFDPASDRGIRRIWRRLAAEGVSSFMEDMGSRPHISLAVYDELDINLARQRLTEFAAAVGRFRLRLSALGQFPGGVVFAAPVVTEELLALHSEYHRRHDDWTGKEWDCYLPGNWFPHCTLAMDLPEEKISQAMEIARQEFAGTEVWVERLALVRYPPAKIELETLLTGGKEKMNWLVAE